MNSLHAVWLTMAVVAMAVLPTRAMARGAYGKLEAAFELPNLTGNPFDYTQNDVKVTLVCPDSQRVTIPAFFDGGQTWRMRFTPTLAGKYAIVAVTLDGQQIDPMNLQPREFNVSGEPGHGFIGVDKQDPHRFIFDDGTPYYPVGYNLGWRQANMPPLTESISRMGTAGVNWTRIWMCHWDGKNLDWAESAANQPRLGELNLAVAHTWDRLIDAAEANGVYLHMVLQHHGQYSTHTNPNWQDNPWNKANGGWLDNPVQFFTDPKAIALTEAKYRYIIARWGYSPSIMAWELFNEVEYTDAYEKDLDAVAAWHVRMAAFIREQDPYHHLITTSSNVNEPKLWPAMDYYEAHTYPPDVLSAMAVLEANKFARPYFYGEIGPGTMTPAASGAGAALHRILWSSLMSQASGAAQYWFWDVVEANHLEHQFTSVQQFIGQSGMLNQRGLKTIEVVAQTPSLTDLSFGSGMGWAPATQTEFTIEPSGFVRGLGGFSSYLQGNGKNHDWFPRATFHVNYPADGTFSVRADEMTVAGANLEISIDGHLMTRMILEAPAAFGPPGGGRQGPARNPRMDTTLQVPVAAGEHTVVLRNTCKDWVHIREISLAPYAPRLAVCAKGNDQFAALWVYRRESAGEQPVEGTLRVPGLSPGTYKVSWWDTSDGKLLSETTDLNGDDGLTLTPPPVGQDVAAWVRRQEP